MRSSYSGSGVHVDRRASRAHRATAYTPPGSRSSCRTRDLARPPGYHTAAHRAGRTAGLRDAVAELGATRLSPSIQPIAVICPSRSDACATSVLMSTPRALRQAPSSRTRGLPPIPTDNSSAPCACGSATRKSENTRNSVGHRKPHVVPGNPGRPPPGDAQPQTLSWPCPTQTLREPSPPTPTAGPHQQVHSTAQQFVQGPRRPGGRSFP